MKSSTRSSRTARQRLAAAKSSAGIPNSDRSFRCTTTQTAALATHVWIKDGSIWVMEATGVFRDGGESTAVNILTPIDAKSFTWQSVKRTLDGVPLPDIPPVKVVRVQAGR